MSQGGRSERGTGTGEDKADLVYIPFAIEERGRRLRKFTSHAAFLFSEKG
jgi:hypothetical protein